MSKRTKKELLDALREALSEGWVSAFQEREDDDTEGIRFAVDHHGEDGEDRRTLLYLNGFDLASQERSRDVLAHALNRHGKTLRVFDDPDDSTDWGDLDTPHADDD